MQHPSSYLGDSIDAPPPTESLFRHMRWLVPLALIGIALLALLLSYSTYSVATILVPDRGGVFREGVAGFPQYLSPIWCQTDDVDHDLCTLIYRGLTRVDKTGRVVPDLAEIWQVIDDKTYIFSLKPEQFWHDGQEVTVDDVLFTVGVLQDPSLLDTPGLPGFWRSVSVEKLDDFTVKFTLPQPFAPFLDYTTIGLLPEHIYAEMPAKELVTSRLDETPIGAGPMRVAELGADYIRLEPSQFYRGWTPYITSLELHFFPDYPSVLAAFDAGAIDGISRILPGDIGVAAERDDLQLFSSVESGYEDVLLNLRNPNTPFFQDIRVRQALLTSIDREAMLEEALAGQGVVAHSLLTPKNWAYNPEVRQYDASPSAAARLLDEAGWIDTDGDRIRDRDGVPLSFVLLVKDDNLHMAVGERLRKDWEAVGVRAEVTPVTFSGLVTDFLAPATFEATLTDWDQAGDPDPYPQWHSSQIDNGGQNYSGWQNETADALMEQARQTTDEGQRRELYQQFQAIFAEELPALPLFYPVYTYGVSDRVNNVQIGSLNSPAERFASFPGWYIDSRRVPVNQVPPDAPPTPPGAAPETDPGN